LDDRAIDNARVSFTPVDEGLKDVSGERVTVPSMKVSATWAVIISAGLVTLVQTRDDLADRLSRRVVQRAPLSIAGRELVQVETEIPVGVESGWHVHPGEEVGYIIAGRIEMSVQGRSTTVLKAGDGFLIPPGTPHNARDLGPETGRMLSSYIVERGQPLSKTVDQRGADQPVRN
jgi:quercetin dioxygenase-like cupin family protein